MLIKENGGSMYHFSGLDPPVLSMHIRLVICSDLHWGYAMCFCIRIAQRESGDRAILSVSLALGMRRYTLSGVQRSPFDASLRRHSLLPWMIGLRAMFDVSIFSCVYHVVVRLHAVCSQIPFRVCSSHYDIQRCGCHIWWLP